MSLQRWRLEDAQHPRKCGSNTCISGSGPAQAEGWTAGGVEGDETMALAGLGSEFRETGGAVCTLLEARAALGVSMLST